MFLSMELLKLMTGTDIVHVSYKGIPQAIADAIGGQIDIVCDNFSSLSPHVRSGRMRALAVTSLKRIPAAPELPTIDEAGIPGFDVSVWSGYSFPAGTPRDRVLRLNAEINKVLSLPSHSKGMLDRGGTPMGGTPEQFSEHIRTETEKWARVIKTAGVKPE